MSSRIVFCLPLGPRRLNDSIVGKDQGSLANFVHVANL